MGALAKILEAIGITEVMIGLVTGLMGDITKEMYFAVAGIAVFAVGWLVQRRTENRAASS